MDGNKTIKDVNLMDFNDAMTFKDAKLKTVRKQS